MTLASVLNTGLSGLQVSQHGLRVASQNIANADTPGYVRADISLAPQIIGGDGAGVEVSAVRRAADKFLAMASYSAQSARASAGARADLLDRAQLLFGDPSSADSLLGALTGVFSSLEALAVEPGASTRQAQAVSSIQTFFSDLSRISADIEGLRQEADDRIASKIVEVNTLSDRIVSLNREIRSIRVSGGDPTGAENLQSQVIGELAKILDVEVAPLELGGVEVRTGRGFLLVGLSGAANLSYTPIAAPFGSPNELKVILPDGGIRQLPGELQSGELVGLIRARDVDLPGLSESLGALAAAAADALNVVHNAHSSAIPQSEFAGRQTGLLGADALNFTGTATFGLVNANGELVRRIVADFSAAPPTLAINGQAPVAIAAAVPSAPTIAEFVAGLNQAMNGAVGPDPADLGDAVFSNGRLTLTSAGTARGVIVMQDEDAPAARAGRGFSEFFGLNDLVSRPNPSFFETGLDGAAQGFSGGPIVLRIRDESGRIVADRSINPAPASVSATLAALNAVATGVGPYAAFSAPDPTDGRVTVTTAQGYRLEVVSDGSLRGSTGVSFTALFGIGTPATSSRARELSVRSDILAAPSRLATGAPDISLDLGVKVLHRGDNRGAQALASAKDRTLSIPASSILPTQTSSLTRFAAVLAGEVGRRAADASRAESAAAAVLTAAEERRSTREGVKLDDELIKMTRFQQSYAAAARLIQAAQEMFDVLLNVV
jgi:flagellar hook-associated protein 1 FlgK